MKDHYDICVAGFWYAYNYGSLLNGYAAYRLLKVMGKEVLMLQKPGAKEDDPEITSGHNTRFVIKHYDKDDISPALPYNRLEELNEICDCFCTGSDQTFNYKLSFNENMYLPFAHDDKRIISFASSFGHKIDNTPDAEKERVKSYLNRFHAISVREQFDVDILEQNYGVTGTLLFEPVFCLEKKVYEEIAAESAIEENEPFLLAYIVNPTPEKREAILYYAEKSDMKAVVILDGNEPQMEHNKKAMDLPNILSDIGVNDFLKLYMDASFVIADSFHGAAFSIIFNKSFLCIGNYERGIDCFVDLFGRLKIPDRLVEEPKNIPLDETYLQQIDYTEANQIVEEEKRKTTEWLKWALETPVEELSSINIEKAETEQKIAPRFINENGLVIIKNVYDYLEQLSNLKDAIVIISVKDTVGLYFDEELQNKMFQLGLEKNLVEKFRVGYVAIINNNAPIFEEITEEAGTLKYETKIEDIDISVTSLPLESGNEAAIWIDGTDYAINQRGLNIVSYDLKNRSLIDSVVIDTHVEELTCHRNRSYLNDHYDIGVIGCWWGANYGSILNGYAVYKTLKKMNLSVLMIQKHNATQDDWEVVDTHSARFVDKFYPEDDVSPVIPFSKLNILNDYCDTFVTGSDQIWNYGINKVFNMVFMLNFVEDSKRKLSFGTSFGHEGNNTPREVLPKTTALLQRYQAISVREESGAKICRDIYALKAKVVCEPVFCLTVDEYCEIADESQIEIPTEPYILTYILDPNEEKRKAILEYMTIADMESINILDGDPRVYDENKEKLNLPNTLEDIGAEDFLCLYKNASFIMTDSFHGTAFALIFNKPFLSITNLKRGKIRFYELLERFGLIDRLAKDSKSIPVKESFLEPIDYTEINKKIAIERSDAIEWLKWSIETPIEELPEIKLPQNDLSTFLKNMPADVKMCQTIAALLRDYGIKHIVISSGTRHMQLVRFFENNSFFIRHNVIDERSAGFYALGIAAKINKPVAVCCTSGTAASNYLSAVSEAYYQHIPLIFLTADRIPRLLNQRGDQMVPQDNMYGKVCLKSVSLVPTNNSFDQAVVRRQVCETIMEATHRLPGPVQINFPMSTIFNLNPPKEYYSLREIKPNKINRYSLLPDRSPWESPVKRLKRSSRILIIYGQHNGLPNQDDITAMNNFASRYNCVICTDHLSNMKCNKSVHVYNALTKKKNDKMLEKLNPDIVITVNGAFVSEINDFVRKCRNFEHWEINKNGDIADPYYKLTNVFECDATRFFKRFKAMAEDNVADDSYYKLWKEYELQNIRDPNANPQRRAIGSLIKHMPAGSLLHLANSRSVRLANYFSLPENVRVFCNRGVNGIDGSMSAFMGQVAVSNELCFLIIGDISFFYDMNALFNKKLKGNIRIMLCNNYSAGLINWFDIEAITHSHSTTAEAWVKSVGFTYFSSHNDAEFDAQIERFTSNEDTPMFFEVFC